MSLAFYEINNHEFTTILWKFDKITETEKNHEIDRLDFFHRVIYNLKIENR